MAVDRPRVAIDLRLAGYRSGGIARYASELLQALRTMPTLEIRSVRSRRDPVIEPGNYRVYTPPHHRFESYGLAAELLLSMGKPDLFHATDFIAPRIPGVPVVATVHDLAFLEHDEHLDEQALQYYRQLERSCAWTSGWITPSNWTADALASAYDVERSAISVIPHGIPAGLDCCHPLPLEQRQYYILAVGTIEPRKHYDLLLDAMTELHKFTGSTLSLVVVGGPGWRSDAVQHRLRTTPWVDWRRNVTDSLLRSLYRSALVVAAPSLAEGFGFSALEAMAAGTPVISSGGGALDEVTGPAALKPVGNDPASWATAINELTTDTVRWRRLAKLGKEQAANFSWSVAAKRTLAVYRMVLARQ